jgi:hypothetical protein
VRVFPVRSSFGAPPCQRCPRGHGDGSLLDTLRPFLFLAEEFAIYLNYVRKLGFEETPDYDFLLELFAKVLKNIGEQDDGIYDWMLLNNGMGWEAGLRHLPTVSTIPYVRATDNIRIRIRPSIHIFINPCPS